ncbi:unnamed protein product [Pleuronectes platessa]|uniref:Uncharacterized protein n=1 Tax=Pleuronectes platessa TaxID=8262 RepID=A0A9N7VR64_PLEPL|nr:unnamed protein product [Pleuronectes platessa]
MEESVRGDTDILQQTTTNQDPRSESDRSGSASSNSNYSAITERPEQRQRAATLWHCGQATLMTGTESSGPDSTQNDIIIQACLSQQPFDCPAVCVRSDPITLTLNLHPFSSLLP